VPIGCGRGSPRSASCSTTAFKLTLVYLTVFAVFAACLLGYFAWNTRRLITEQITHRRCRITGLSSSTTGRHQRLVFIIDARARRPGSALSGDDVQRRRARRQCQAAGRGRAGACRLDRDGLSPARRPDGTEHHALVRVFNCRTVSGFWSAAISRARTACTSSRQPVVDAVVIVLGLAGGFLVARRVLAASMP
jgi:hypothetical protein